MHSVYLGADLAPAPYHPPHHGHGTVPRRHGAGRPTDAAVRERPEMLPFRRDGSWPGRDNLAQLQTTAGACEVDPDQD